MEHEGVSKVVRLLQSGTTLLAINDANDDVQGMVEAFRFMQYTRSTGETSYEVEYRVKWTDGVYEWISWSEADTYNPKRPTPQGQPLTPRYRERVNA